MAHTPPPAAAKIAKMRKKKSLPPTTPLYTRTPRPFKVPATAPPVARAMSPETPASLPIQRTVHFAPTRLLHVQPRLFGPPVASIDTPATPSRAHKLPIRSSPPRRHYVWLKDKLKAVLKLLKDFGLTLGSFLVHLFSRYDKKGRRLRHSRTVVSSVSQFLSGNSTGTVSQLLELWMAHPYGQPGPAHPERQRMYQLTPPYTESTYARPALTCFAAQICADRISRDAARAVKPDAGLHLRVRVPRSLNVTHSNAPKRQLLMRKDLGTNVVDRAKEVLQRECSLLYGLSLRAATRKGGKVLATRVQRPPEIVVTGALSSLLFSRRRTANLLPLSNGLAYFAARAEQSLFRIASRFGQSTAYTTAYRALITLADGQAKDLCALARSNVVCVSVTLDNAQHFGAQYDVRAGRADTMYKGVVGTLLLWEDCPPSALDEAAMNAFVKARKAGPGELSWRDIVSHIDRPLIETAGVLHWLDVAVSRCKALHSAYKNDIQRLFATEVHKHQIPVNRRTTAYPLRSNAHDPSLATGLKDAVLDFYANQLGLTEENWQPKLMFFGGDGGTFEGLLRLQKYLQVAPNAYERLDWMAGLLHLWHTKWTTESRVANNHWGSDRSPDPSCLGNSARIIKRKTPSNLKKVDFSRETETIFTIGENRMLDCWRVILDVEDLDAHFDDLSAAGQLPSLAELRSFATRLYRTYSCHRAYLQALHPYERQSAEYRAPLAKHTATQLHAATYAAATTETAGMTGHTEQPGFAGDRCLANSILFLQEFVELREWFRSTSVGEIGSTWEIVKNQIPKFAGSGHNPNYLNYCLSMFLIIEKYATPSMREAILNNWLVNFVGRPGHFKEGDLMQEHFINRLDRHLQHKDRPYDEPFIRDVVSPNLDLLTEIPRQLEEAVSLKARSKRHLTPNAKTEARLLAEHYKNSELHRFSKGRSLGFAAKDHVSIGVQRLMDPADVFKRFRDFHSSLDVLNAPISREPIVPQSKTMEVPSDHPDGTSEQADSVASSDDDEQVFDTAAHTAVRTDGLEDTILNDQSEEITPAPLANRTAVYFSEGGFALEETDEELAGASPDDTVLPLADIDEDSMDEAVDGSDLQSDYHETDGDGGSSDEDGERDSLSE